jgi:limonene-1,2-epoxide hydrolase
MFRRSYLVVVIGAIVTVVAVGCGKDRSSEAIKVTKDFYAAINAADVDKAMRYVADTAIFVNPHGTFRGVEEVRNELIRNNGLINFEHSNFRVKDGRVVYDFKVKDANGRVIVQGTDGLTIVEDEMIVFDGTERTEQGR